MDKINCDILIIGGGVIGSACALKLSQRGYNCILLEADAHLGTHTSSRNSEVIHAGIYYPTRSLKHLACVEGKQLLYRYLNENSIPHHNCGKIIFAIDDVSSKALFKLYDQSINNGVAIHKMSRSQLKGLPEIIDCKEALYSADTGIFNSAEFLKSLVYKFEENDGLIATKTRVANIEFNRDKFLSTCEGPTDKFFIQSKKIVNAAGANSLNILKNTFPHKYLNYENYFIKGHYFNLKSKIKFDKLYYPVPNNLGLGVHLTIDCNGDVKFGPDTVVSDGPYEYNQQTQLHEMYEYISQNFSGLSQKDLSYGYCGVRPKITINGNRYDDFKIAVDCNANFVSLIGIESPGLTSCLSLADMVSSHF